MVFLEQLQYLDAHFARGINDETLHLRMVGHDGNLITVCGSTFFDWVRDEPNGNLCRDCLEDLAYWLLEQERNKKPEFEHLDWTKERNLLRVRVYEHRN